MKLYRINNDLFFKYFLKEMGFLAEANKVILLCSDFSLNQRELVEISEMP